MPAIVLDTQRRILITGAGGFIGGALTRRLQSAGHDVRALDLPGAIGRANARIPIAHDLRTRVPECALDGVDAVIHAAALAGVQSSWERPDAYWEVNAGATELLRAACEGAGRPRVVHLSSISIYGEGLKLNERSAPHPLSPYGRSKLAGERAWDGYPRALTVRLSNVYGPGQRSDMAYATFIRAALAGHPITLRDGGRQLRTPTYIDDCVSGIVAALDGGRSGEVYNVAGPEDVRLTEVPRLLSALLGEPVATRASTPAPGDPRVATVSSERARRELGYEARTTLSTGLATQFVAWCDTAATAVNAAAATS